MEPVAFTRHAVLTAKQMQQVDQATIASGIAGLTLMQRAGQVVFEEIVVHYGRRLVVVLCGPGNNGGDGYIIAQLLLEAGWDVQVVALKLVNALQGDAAKAASTWQGKTIALSDYLNAISNEEAQSGDSPNRSKQNFPPLIIDALFGTGLVRELEGEVAELIDMVNSYGWPVVAVDMPSGIGSDGGEIMGMAFQAELTVTFCRKKRGHLLLPGRERCGKIVVRDIGIPSVIVTQQQPECSENIPELWQDLLPVLPAGSYKQTRGHVLVRGGIAGMTGAAVLAALAALRSGGGLVSVQVTKDTLSAYQQHPVLMTEQAAYSDAMAGTRYDAAVMGPGNGVDQETREAVLAMLATGKPCVLDADALSAFAGKAEQLAAAIQGPCILTPHAEEFRRLFGEELDALISNEEARVIAERCKKERCSASTDRASRERRTSARAGENRSPNRSKQITSGDCALPRASMRSQQKITVTLAAAKLTGAVVIHKGADTVIASPDGRVVINGNAPPWLATAGSGDVLAGMCGGLLAQGMPVFEAACAVVWLHGQAAQELGEGLIAQDLLEKIGYIWQKLEMGLYGQITKKSGY